MFSNVFKAALEKEIAGQAYAVNSVVRGVVRAVSGLVPREGPLCAYMFMGPTGTGKTHLVHTLARILHGDDRRTVVADCTHFAHGDPWMAFVGQLTPVFTVPRMENKWSVLDAAPLSIVLIEYLERGPKEVTKALAAALETGQLTLPEGRRGSLRNCLVFMTTGLCAKEILDEAPQIGFSGSEEGHDEHEDRLEKLFKLGRTTARETFGTDLMGRLDSLILFHRLEPEHLDAILDRLNDNLNHWLGGRGLRCEMRPSAREFLLERGRRELRAGARDLVRAHRRFVEFPVADLLISGQIPAGGHVIVDRDTGDDHLHFTVEPRQVDSTSGFPETGLREIPVS
ncbi:MAG: AAA family ATPase [Acidobacteriota bacterium]|nr:AAA family ATPase [Acidobacteriota bacterium]